MTHSEHDDDLPEDLVDGLAAGFGPADSNAPRLSMLDRIARETGTSPRITLRDEPSEMPAKVLRALSQAAPGLSRSSGKYQLQGELARGGMAVVLKGHDMDLSRDVAVKVLRKEYGNDPDVLQRFVEEAQIGGQMQHPGIVPVYDLGMNQGRPYFTMKLIKGRTLAAILAGRENIRDGRRRLLTIFEQVCQTMAYAHARGVIHRDLKPANVMVGSFGEVQVVDWGMGKVLHAGGVADEARSQRKTELSVIATVRSKSTKVGSHSVVGSVMGTPAYMPPEQANGDVEHMDERSDVFALGAILCEILTGAPPYVGKSEELLLMAAKARLEPCKQRLGGCGADTELVDIVLDCLMPAPATRPRSAEIVAERVAHYLASLEERAQQAKIEAAEERVRATAARRAHRLTLALAASVLVTVGVGGTGYWWLEHERAARALQDNAKVQDALDSARIAQGRARHGENANLWEAALTIADNAMGLTRAEGVTLGLRQRVEALHAEVSRERDRAVARETRLDRERRMLVHLGTVPIPPDESGGHKTDRRHLPESRRRDQAYRQAFEDFGLPVEHMPPEQVGARIRAMEHTQSWAAALDDWALAATVLHPGGEKAAHLLAAAKAADPDPQRCALRDIMLEHDFQPAKLLRIADESHDAPPMTVVLLAEMLATRWKGERAIELLRAAYARNPGNYNLVFKLANLLGPATWGASGSHRKRITREEALRFATVAAALRPNSATAAFVLGVCLRTLNRLPEAEAAFRNSIRIDDSQPQAYHNLAHILQSQGRVEEAVPYFEKAIALAPKQLDVGRSCLGYALRALGREEEAKAAFRELRGLQRKAQKQALEEAKQAVDEEPSAESHSWLATLLARKEMYQEGLEEINAAIDLRPRFALLHANRGSILARMGHLDDAIAAYRTAVELDKNDVFNVRGLGWALFQRGKIAEAVEVYRHTLPSAMLRFRLAQHFQDLGRRQEAIAELREALRLDPSHVQARTKLGSLLQQAGCLEQATAAFRQVLRDDPYSARCHHNLGVVRMQQGRFEEAAQHLAEAVRFSPGWGAPICMQGRLLQQQGRYDEAMAKLEKGLSLALYDPGFRRKAAGCLAEVRRLAAMGQRLEPMLEGELSPSTEHEYAGAAQLAHARKDYVRAAQLYREAFAKHPSLGSDSTHRYNAACAAVLAGTDAWRKQALEWATGVLEHQKESARHEPNTVLTQLNLWLEDRDFHRVRAKDALRSLPTKDRAQWKALWKAVRSLRTELTGR